MPLKLMYITNRPDVALVAEAAGVDRVFVDMEFIGKGRRQGGMDSVQNSHTVEDVRALRAALTSSELLVRVNPIHNELVSGPMAGYPSSEDEIDQVIDAGADVLMLPYYRTADEAARFLGHVAGRARTMLLVETAAAAQCLDEVLRLPGLDEVYIGLNDLSLSYGYSFMFEPLANGMVEAMCHRIRRAGLPYGFGGIAALGRGAVPAEMIVKEHYRLGSTMAILSRSFCNAEACKSLAEVEGTFRSGIAEIRSLERECARHADYFWDNERRFREAEQRVVHGVVA